MEPYPQNMDQWKTMACERYPNADFDAVSRYKWGDVATAYSNTSLAVGGEKAMAIHTDFALVTAAVLEGQVILSEGRLHHFDEHHRVWRVTNEKPVADIIKTSVHRIWGVRSVSLKYGAKLQAAGYPAITTESLDLPEFYFAEDYHQQYLAIPGNRQYCSAEPTGVVLPPIEEWPGLTEEQRERFVDKR